MAKTVRTFLPPQHGAWAMLLLPWLTGVAITGFRWPDVPLLLAWLSGYLASYFALLAVKTRRPGKVRAQLWLYTTSTALFGAIVLTSVPAVLWYAPAYAVLLAVNVIYAARRDDRALLNDLALVIQSCLLVGICATIADQPISTVALAFTALMAYFVGVVIHVKALIRERNNPRYRRASIVYHSVAFAASLLAGLAMAVMFGLLALRALAAAGRTLRPGVVGAIEIVASAALLATLTLG